MESIYICVIIATALGFWKTTSKDQEKKTDNASFFKVALFGLLFSITCFLYIKSYQVATFKCLINVKGYYGSFNENKENLDTVYNLTIFNRFHEKKWDKYSSLILNDSSRYSGLYTLLHLNNDSNQYLRFKDNDFINDSVKHLYRLQFVATSVANIFPLIKYNKEDFAEIQKEDNNYVHIASQKNDINYFSNIDYLYDEDKSSPLLGLYSDNYVYTLKKDSLHKDYYLTNLITSDKKINSLNFFSLADLSQCIYEIYIDSDIPVKSFYMYYDMPVEINSLNNLRDLIYVNGFQTFDINQANYKPLKLHVKFPTQSNLQLIRSLILTTILTALLTLLLTNLYYWVRKHVNRQIKKHRIKHLLEKKDLIKLHFFWIPLGKGILWLILVGFFLYLLFLIFKTPILIEEGMILYFKILMFALLASFITCVVIFYYIFYLFILYKHQKLVNKRKKIKEQNNE